MVGGDQISGRGDERDGYKTEGQSNDYSGF